MMALRILVVEDEAMIAMLLTELLKEMGHEVCAVASREADAVAAALRHRPDLMIVDAQLKEGSGVSAVERILRVLPVPHVFVSGDIVAVRARKPGAVVIQKPFREAELALAIERVIAGKIAASPSACA